MNRYLKFFKSISLMLVIIGGLNWLLIGVLSFNLVSAIFGWAPVIEKIIYIIIGVAAVFNISEVTKHCPKK